MKTIFNSATIRINRTAIQIRSRSALKLRQQSLSYSAAPFGNLQKSCKFCYQIVTKLWLVLIVAYRAEYGIQFAQQQTKGKKMLDLETLDKYLDLFSKGKIDGTELAELILKGNK